MSVRLPYSWYGSKALVADEIWLRLGDVPVFVEPFAGSAATLLARPSPPRMEILNDANGYISNFFRASKWAADEVAYWCDWPINEVDLRARHAWLCKDQASFIERMMEDPDYYDAKIAGLWVHGQAQWLGSGWCRINAKTIERKRPLISPSPSGILRRDLDVHAYFAELQARLRYVNVLCGDWSRAVTKKLTYSNGLTAILMDPPYTEETGRYPVGLYSSDDGSVAHDVREWCLENADNPLLRLALCGYSNEHDMPDDWEVFEWSSTGGSEENRHKERIWFSPHCLKPRERLF